MEIVCKELCRLKDSGEGSFLPHIEVMSRIGFMLAQDGNKTLSNDEIWFLEQIQQTLFFFEKNKEKLAA